MIEFQQLNDPNFPCQDYDALAVDFKELFQLPEHLSAAEKKLAQEVMEKLGFEYDEEYIMELRCTPVHLMSLIVQIKRISDVLSK